MNTYPSSSLAIGSPIVHFYHGAGYVAEPEELIVAGKSEKFIHILLLDSSRIKIPFAEAAAVLRAPAVNDVIYRRIVNIIKRQRLAHDGQTIKQHWHISKKDAHTRLRTGNLLEIAKVVRDMIPDSTPEAHALLRQALRRLISEIAFSYHISPVEAGRQLAAATGIPNILWPKSIFDISKPSSSELVRRAEARHINEQLEQEAQEILARLT